MPKVRRSGLPKALLRHLLQRIQERSIGPDQLAELASWLDGEPEVPRYRWFKRFPGMTVCGEADLILTILTPDQAPVGTPVL